MKIICLLVGALVAGGNISAAGLTYSMTTPRMFYGMSGSTVTIATDTVTLIGYISAPVSTHTTISPSYGSWVCYTDTITTAGQVWVAATNAFEIGFGVPLRDSACITFDKPLLFGGTYYGIAETALPIRVFLGINRPRQ